MKRAIFILIAALLVLLVYPSTHAYAKSPKPGIITGPTVITPVSDGGPTSYTDSNDDGSDDGDSDDVAGWRDRDTKPGDRTPAGEIVYTPRGLGVVYKMWWNLMIWIR